MTNESENPSYEVARDKLHAMFAELVNRGIKVSISEPFPEVREKGTWPCIGYNVSFNGKVFPWFMGIGHVKVPNGVTPYGSSPNDFALTRCGAQYDDSRYFFHGNWDKCEPKKSARMAVVLAKYQKLQPDVAEVLARVCADATSADVLFEDWAADFGYDADSISAKEVYDDCTRYGKMARSFLTRAEFDAFAELANEL